MAERDPKGPPVDADGYYTVKVKKGSPLGNAYTSLLGGAGIGVGLGLGMDQTLLTRCMIWVFSGYLTWKRINFTSVQSG